MSKKIDWSHLGGFPLCQDDIQWMGDGLWEAITGLAQMGGGTGPFAISGIAITRTLVAGTVYNWSNTAGLVFFNGDVIIVNASAGTVTIDESINAPYLVFTPTGGTLGFNDGSTPAVQLNNSGGLVALPIGTADSSTQFLLSELKPFGREAAETTIAVSTGSGAGTIGGNLSYRKNFLTNTLHIHFAAGVSSPSDFAAFPSTSTVLLATLPTGYFPKSAHFFFNATLGDSALPVAWQWIKVNSSLYISNLAGGFLTNGNLYLNMVKPDATVASYAVYFNLIVPLD